MSRGPQKQFDRNQVLDKAMHLFWSQGYEATSMTQLLEAMGIGRQSLYDTFGDKRALFLAALDRYMQLYIAPMAARLSAPGSPMNNVKAFLRMAAEMVVDSDYHGCLVGNTVAELARQDPEVAHALEQAFARTEGLLTQTLERAREAGELKSTLAPRELARMLIVTSHGLALLTKLEAHRRWARSAIKSAVAMLEGS